MKLLTREIEAVPAPPAGEPGEPLPEVPDFACATCGAGMAADQDWCLECGAAAPGRLGAKPGWRAALTVTSLTVLLVLGAVVAAYAALSSDAEREAGLAGGPNGAPIQAQVPPAGNPPAPGTVPPAGALPESEAGEPLEIPSPSPSAPPSDASELPDLPSSSSSPPPSPSLPSFGGGSPGSSGGGGGGTDPSSDGGGSGGSSGGTAGEPPIGAVDIGPRASSVYDPYDRRGDGAEFGIPGDAHDGNAKTVWDVTVPADGERIKVGLLVKFDQPRDLRELRLETPTPGFTVEVYGASGTERPVDVLDKRWKNLRVRGNVQDGQRISLNQDVGEVRQLLLWFTKPANEEDPRVAIGELRLRGR